MIVLGLDPGPAHSAIVEYEPGGENVIRFACAKLNNQDILNAVAANLLPVDLIGHFTASIGFHATELVIERMQSFGRVIGFDVLETARWSGRFEQAFCGLGCCATWLTSPQVKKHLGVQSGTGDSGVMHALLDRWGGRQKAVGTTKARGPLYGISSHAWRALALAVTYCDLHPTP